MKNSHPRINLTILLAAAFLGLAATTFAVEPPPGGGYPGENTALGDNALFSLVTGSQGENTARFYALYANTIGTGTAPPV